MAPPLPREPYTFFEDLPCLPKKNSLFVFVIPQLVKKVLLKHNILKYKKPAEFTRRFFFILSSILYLNGN